MLKIILISKMLLNHTQYKQTVSNFNDSSTVFSLTMISSVKYTKNTLINTDSLHLKQVLLFWKLTLDITTYAVILNVETSARAYTLK